MRRPKRNYGRSWWYGHREEETNNQVRKQAWNRQPVITTPEELKEVEKTHRHLIKYRKTLGEGDEKVQVDVQIQAMLFAENSVEAQAVREIAALKKIIASRKKANIPCDDLIKKLWKAEAVLAVYQDDPPIIPPPIINPPPAIQKKK